MAKTLLFDCACSEVWVHPENWRSLNTQKSLKLDWYVECKFYDPEFKDKYPKGFPFRKKVNRFRTLEERKGAISFLLKEIPRLLEDRGYNPITKKFMIEQVKHGISSDTCFKEVMLQMYPKIDTSEKTLKDIKCVVLNFCKTADKLRIDCKMSELHSGHIRDILDYLKLSPNRYNKYLSYLSILFSDLLEKRLMFNNPTRDIKKKKIVKNIRETFEVEELQQIFEYLKENYYTFYRYGMIFFHSGARTSELYRVQKKDVNIEKREYKVLIKKGSVSKFVIKVILSNSLEYWQEILSECESDEDFLFAKDLRPSEIPTQPYQITKRFKRLIKDRLCFADGKLKPIKDLKKGENHRLITADFYSLKHLFLDLLDSITEENQSLSKSMASHTTNVTERVYLVGREGRKNEALKKIKIDIL
ncbi:tyrosine-type recombinase/integrase [Flavobacterium sp. SUN046]|uniref:tyrosine-type recombinase/integrase n=1 Tax=Flavobacterium sp. SUN046 TaxID=3002440 RepID=UPI002DB7B37F|nr:tyrosine-type recombinase/integrase [Flavobacterium sp. SUN046]MEC4050612.1 tyrosine-type recombinase/integrase [Flavobacterium sp. SUN046]